MICARTTPVTPPNWAVTAVCARPYGGDVSERVDPEGYEYPEDDPRGDDAASVTRREIRRAVIITVVALLAIIVSSILFVLADVAG